MRNNGSLNSRRGIPARHRFLLGYFRPGRYHCAAMESAHLDRLPCLNTVPGASMFSWIVQWRTLAPSTA